LKQFKLNMISDQPVTEAEFNRMKFENPEYNVTQDYLKKKLDEMSEATKFQYDTELLTRLVSK